MFTAKRSTAFANKSVLENVSNQPYDVLVSQFISDPMAAQTISGTIKGQLRVYEDNAAADFCRAVVVKVVSEDCSVLRGALLSHFPPSLVSEFAGSATNRYFPPSTAVTQVVCQDGDRMVVEVGYRSFNAVTTAYTGYFRFGDNSASDLPEDETDTHDYNPWLEFSQTLTFLPRQLVHQAQERVEYFVAPLDKVTQAFAQVEVPRLATGQYVFQTSLQVEYSDAAAVFRTFPVPNAKTRWQSQAGKRKFPIIH
jgi:hypothetical protein